MGATRQPRQWRRTLCARGWRGDKNGYRCPRLLLPSCSFLLPLPSPSVLSLSLPPAAAALALLPCFRPSPAPVCPRLLSPALACSHLLSPALACSLLVGTITYGTAATTKFIDAIHAASAPVAEPQQRPRTPAITRDSAGAFGSTRDAILGRAPASYYFQAPSSSPSHLLSAIAAAWQPGCQGWTEATARCGGGDSDACAAHGGSGDIMRPYSRYTQL